MNCSFFFVLLICWHLTKHKTISEVKIKPVYKAQKHDSTLLKKHPVYSPKHEASGLAPFLGYMRWRVRLFDGFLKYVKGK